MEGPGVPARQAGEGVRVREDQAQGECAGALIRSFASWTCCWTWEGNAWRCELHADCTDRASRGPIAAAGLLRRPMSCSSSDATPAHLSPPFSALLFVASCPPGPPAIWWRRAVLPRGFSRSFPSGAGDALSLTATTAGSLTRRTTSPGTPRSGRSARASPLTWRWWRRRTCSTFMPTGTTAPSWTWRATRR